MKYINKLLRKIKKQFKIDCKIFENCLFYNKPRPVYETTYQIYFKENGTKFSSIRQKDLRKVTYKRLISDICKGLFGNNYSSYVKLIKENENKLKMNIINRLHLIFPLIQI